MVTGIGFLGAGAIIQMKGSVRGLTTAAGIWMVATIGMAVGVGMYWISLIATLMILFVLAQLERFERHINMGNEARIIRVRVNGIVDDIEQYKKALRMHKVVLTNFYVDYDFDDNMTHLNLVVLVPENVNYITLFKTLKTVYSTKSITLSTQVSI